MSRESLEVVRQGRDVVAGGLLVFGLYLVGVSAFAVVAPATFFEELARFGTRNDHYIHDGAAFQAAVGLLLLLAIRRRAWRVPALTVAVLQFGLHSLSHLADVDKAHSQQRGVLAFVTLALATAVLVWLLRRATLEEAAGRRE